MIKVYRKYILTCSILCLLFLLAACSMPRSADTGNTNTSTSGQQRQEQVGTTPASTAQRSSTPITSKQQGGIVPTVVISTAVPANSTPDTSSGPIVILSPTPVPGGSSHSQMVTLPDRTLVISDASKVAGADASSTGIRLVMTMKNTSTKTIPNEESYYQLIAAEGDSFGLQPSVTSSFFGMIGPSSSRSGTVVFQVPSAALNGGLRMEFRSEVDTETVFVPLNV